MRIGAHHPTIHRQSFTFCFNAKLPYLYIAVRSEQIHSLIDGPLRARRDLHIPEFLNWLYRWLTLKQTNSLLTSHRGLQVIIIGICRMMSDNDIRFTFTDCTLNKLYQLKMWHRVHLDIRKCSLILLAHANIVGRSISIAFQFCIRRTKSSCFCLRTHYGYVYFVAFMRPFPH